MRDRLVTAAVTRLPDEVRYVTTFGLEQGRLQGVSDDRYVAVFSVESEGSGAENRRAHEAREAAEPGTAASNEPPPPPADRAPSA